MPMGPEDYHGSPRWSPDGRRIAFDARGKDGRWNIKVVESSGGQSPQLTSGPFTSTAPTWSHDGKWIYFASDRSGRFEIWRMPSEGSSTEQFTHDGGYMAIESPDGRTLYYTKTGGDGPLFARLLGGGDEEQVLESVARRGFAVFEDGIYYLYADSRGAAKCEIRFHEFATGRSRLVGPIEGRLKPVSLRFTRPEDISVYPGGFSGKRSHADRELPVRQTSAEKPAAGRNARQECPMPLTLSPLS